MTRRAAHVHVTHFCDVYVHGFFHQFVTMIIDVCGVCVHCSITVLVAYAYATAPLPGIELCSALLCKAQLHLFFSRTVAGRVPGTIK